MVASGDEQPTRRSAEESNESRKEIRSLVAMAMASDVVDDPLTSKPHRLPVPAALNLAACGIKAAECFSPSARSARILHRQPGDGMFLNGQLGGLESPRQLLDHITGFCSYWGVTANTWSKTCISPIMSQLSQMVFALGKGKSIVGLYRF